METARPLNFAIIASGIWLIVSAFAWRHMPAQAINAAAVGVAAIVLGVVALRRTPRAALARYLVVPLGAWLLVSGWVLPARTALTVANHLFVASILLGVAMLPIDPEDAPRQDHFPA